MFGFLQTWVLTSYTLKAEVGYLQLSVNYDRFDSVFIILAFKVLPLQHRPVTITIQASSCYTSSSSESGRLGATESCTLLNFSRTSKCICREFAAPGFEWRYRETCGSDNTESYRHRRLVTALGFGVTGP